MSWCPDCLSFSPALLRQQNNTLNRGAGRSVPVRRKKPGPQEVDLRARWTRADASSRRRKKRAEHARWCVAAEKLEWTGAAWGRARLTFDVSFRPLAFFFFFLSLFFSSPREPRIRPLYPRGSSRQVAELVIASLVRRLLFFLISFSFFLFFCRVFKTVFLFGLRTVGQYAVVVAFPLLSRKLPLTLANPEWTEWAYLTHITSYLWS